MISDSCIFMPCKSEKITESSGIMSHKIKILLAEDTAPMRKVEVAELHSLGFANILEAEDGNAAIRILREHPDTALIISDWNMPGKSGFQLLTWVRANPAYEHIPFIMATAQGDRRQARRAVEAGVSSMLTKPFDAEELKSGIDEAMGWGEKKSGEKEKIAGPQMGTEGKIRLRVAHIQITDHLILGVLRHLIESGEMRPLHFELAPVLMPGWNPVEHALEEGSVDAACILAPIAMDLFGDGVPIRLVLLTHREGSIFVRNEPGQYREPFQDFFEGKSVLIPHKMSVHHMLAHRFFAGMGLKLGVAGQPGTDVQYEVTDPVMMPEFMKGNPDIAGFIVAEPVGSLAVDAGIAEKGFLSASLWENHPCCVLAVRDDFIASHENALYEFCRMLVQAGQYMEDYPEKAAEIGLDFLDPAGTLGLRHSLLRQVLAAGVRTRDLFPMQEDFEKIQDYMFNEMKVGKKIDIGNFIDIRFAAAAQQVQTQKDILQSAPEFSEAEAGEKPPAEKTSFPIPDEKEEGENLSVLPDSGNGHHDEDYEEDRSETIRISTEILDQLMASVGELVLIRNRERMCADMTDPAARSIAQRLDLVTGRIQENILLTRMQPVGNVFAKLPRIVREMGKKYGKNIEISFQGRECRVDKNVLESLALPLSYIIAFSCRRGIESPEERKAAGKAVSGRIEVRAEKTAGEIHIRVRDDGRGIDADSLKKYLIRRKIRRGKELSGMGEREILSLLFLPEFASGITEGEKKEEYGQGFYPVRECIEKFRGTAEIESVPGKGTVLFLRFPLTLAIIPAMVLVCGKHRYVIPRHSTEELFCLYDDEIGRKTENAGDQKVFRLRGQLLPLIHLNEVLGKGKEKIKNSLTFAVVRAGKQRFGLIADRIIGSEDIVVQPMHPALSDLQIYSGAALMGDGKAALILNIEGIARHSGICSGLSRGKNIGKAVKAGDSRTVLFKSGRFEHFAVALPQIRRVERIRMADVEKVGDREFISVAGVSTLILHPDRIFSVSPAIIKEEMFLILPKSIPRPFGILVSEILDTVAVSGEISSKSHPEDGLLGTAIVRGNMTLFIDISRIIEIAEPGCFAGH